MHHELTIVKFQLKIRKKNIKQTNSDNEYDTRLTLHHDFSRLKLHLH